MWTGVKSDEPAGFLYWISSRAMPAGCERVVHRTALANLSSSHQLPPKPEPPRVHIYRVSDSFYTRFLWPCSVPLCPTITSTPMSKTVGVMFGFGFVTGARLLTSAFCLWFIVDVNKIPPVKFQEIVRDGQATIVSDYCVRGCSRWADSRAIGCTNEGFYSGYSTRSCL